MKTKIFLLHLIGFGLLFGSCDKTDSFEEDIKKGEIVYAVKPNKIIARSGNERVELSLQFEVEPKVKSIKVYWNFRADSTTFNIAATSQRTINLMLNGMKKGSYSFEVYTYDSEGNKSVKTEAIGQVYTNEDLQSLADTEMMLKSTNIINRFGVLEWYRTDYFAGIHVEYTDISNTPRVAHMTDISRLTVLLEGAKPGSAYRYQTLYLPEQNSLDTARTAFTSGTLPLYSQLDKKQFREYFIPPAQLKLPGDYVVAPAVVSGVTLDLKKAWDDRYGDNDAYQSGNAALTAQTFTLDLGVTKKLGFMEIFQRGIKNSPLEATMLYNAGNLKGWELWGRADEPNPNGSYTGWIKLGDYSYSKPSNSPRGTNTAEDKATANEGHWITISASAPEVRYLRLKPTSNWAGVTNISILELSLFEPLY